MRKNFAVVALLVVLLVAYLVLVGQFVPSARAPSPSQRTQQIWPRPQSLLFDLAPMPRLNRGEVSQGTAFNIDGAGLWLTARHVVTPCLAGQFRGEIDGQPITLTTADGHNDVAMVRAGARAIKGMGVHVTYASQQNGTHATIVGFPGSRPAEVAVERIGSGTARSEGGAEAISVWADMGRSPAGDYALSGMSGAPVLDDLDNVVGVLSAEVPRRGRVLVARVGDWIADEGHHIVPARSFAEDLPAGGLVSLMTGSHTVARLRCSS